MEVEAQVIWINPPRDDGENRQPGMGLEFVDLSPTQREQVLRLVRTFAYLPDEEGEDEASSGDDGDRSERLVDGPGLSPRGSRRPALC